MKIIIMGGGGAMAKAMTWELIENDLITEIVLADLDREKAETFAGTLNSKKVSVKYLDASKHDQMVQEFKTASFVANSSWYELNIPIMKACLEAKVHYADLGGLYYKTMKQLKMDDAFKTTGITALIGIGASPGMTNLCVAKALKTLDTIEDIHIRTGASGGKGFAYSAKTVLDEVTMQPAAYVDGEIKFLKPLSGREKYTLPEPVGEVEGVYSIHSELATLPYFSSSIKNVSFRVAFSPKLLSTIDALVSLRLLSDDTVEIGGTEITAKDFLYKFFSRLPEPDYTDECKSFRVDIKGLKEGKKLHCKYQILANSLPGKKLKATTIWTGVPLAVAADLILRGVIEKKGVFAPEQLEPDTFLRELAKRNLAITEEVDAQY